VHNPGCASRSIPVLELTPEESDGFSTPGKTPLKSEKRGENNHGFNTVFTPEGEEYSIPDLSVT